MLRTSAKIHGFHSAYQENKGEKMVREFLKKLESTHGRLGVMILRVILGLIFFKAGSGKLFGWFGGLGIEGVTQFFQDLGIPAPHAQAIFVGCTELLGGLALISGFLTRL